MDWLKNWNEALDYLEDNLEGNVSLDRLGQKVGCSAYHFQRMFSYLVGVPLHEYLRRRRMTRAAAGLQRGEKVLDVALRYGYESPTAFNRAFQSVHGIPPSRAKQTGAKLKAYPRIRFKYILKGAEEMEYQLIKREAFHIVGFRTQIPRDQEESFQLVPQFWQATGPKLPRLLPLMCAQMPGILGVCTYYKDKENYYYIAVSSDAPPLGDMSEWTVPAATWAVFSGQGQLPMAIQELQRRVITEWLPDSGYELAEVPDLEIYLDPPEKGECRFQVWLPVTRH